MLVLRPSQILFSCLLLMLSKALLASPPVPFNSAYEVKVFGGLNAEAELSLESFESSEYKMHAMVKLKFFRKVLTKANAEANLFWEDGHAIPQNYEYIQTGLGHRQNSIDYDWINQSATIVVNDEVTVQPIAETMLDELSMYVEIQQQAAAGVEDIHLNVIDEGKIKEYHYKLLGEEQIETPLGLFNTLKYLRVRKPGSKNVTELWLAKDWNYLVLQLKQKTRIRTFKINLRHATVNEAKVVPLNSIDP